MVDEHKSENPPTPDEITEWIHTWLTQPNRERSKFTDIILVVLTIVIAAAAIWSAFIFQGQLDEAHKASVATERAWLGLAGPVKINLLDMSPPRLKLESEFEIRNFGHGPAFKVFPEGAFATNLEDLTRWATSLCSAATHFTTGKDIRGNRVSQPWGKVLFPNQPLVDFIGEPNDPWTADSNTDIKQVYFIGCVTYRDQFGDFHWTRFCMESPNFGPAPLNSSTPLHPCNVYNDTDEKQDDK